MVAEMNAVCHEWYDGIVIDYDACEKRHGIQYDGEVKSCKLELILDMLTGDLQIL